jgi:hypothetical protein
MLNDVLLLAVREAELLITHCAFLLTAGGLISGLPRQGWRVFCQSRQMGEMSLVRVKADYV